jgi:hypothetical protein
MNLEKRIEKLENVVDPKQLEPLIIYSHMTEAECAKFNTPPVKGNPLMVIVKPCPDEVKP